MKYKGFNIMKKRFLAALLCLCLLVGLVPGMGTTAFAAGSYNIGDTVTFAGHDWYIIGTESDGVKAPSGCYTLFAKNNDFGSTAFRAGAESTNSTANYYKNSDLQKKMEEIASGFSAGDKASIVARDTLDGIAGDAVNDQLLWPVSEAEWNGIDKSLRAFPADYWTRESWEGDVGTLDAPRYVYRVHKALADGRNLDGNAGVLVRPPEVTETFAIRPALYVKAEALPEKVDGIQVAFGGQWWYVVGQGEKGSVPGPENTVTLFENPREKLGAQPVSAYTSASSYLKSFLQEEMAVFGSKYLNLAGKESSLIVPRTLTSADGINGQTAHDQPFWPLSKDEADRTDAEILKSELYDDVSSVGRYWLRTTNNAGGFSFVYAVQGTDGKVVSDTQNKYYGVRPAFYLDISDAFYLAKDVKRVTIGGNPYPLVVGEGFDDLEVYKYTIFDDSLKLSVTADPTQAAQTGETLSFGYAANTGENQYLSCVLTPDDSTDVLYYNKLVELSDTAAASGTVNIPLTGVSNGNYTLRLYTEQENNRSTDFASRAVNVKITVKDGVASIRDLGNIQLVGDSGGQDGREVELRTNEETRQIQWKYTDEPDTAWRDLVALDAITGGDGADGADGREVELQVANGYIPWRYTTGADTDWKNLRPLSDLKGEDGEDGREVELKNDGSSILWRYVGEGDDAWRPLVDLSDITGSDGADGKQVELRVEGGYIQWKYDADSDWQNLIALSALQGIKGDKGDKGDPGEDGDTPYIGDNGNWWIGGVDTGIKAEGSDGADGSDGSDGKDGQDGKDGEDGKDGLTPYIGSNGNWWIGTTDTGIKAAGVNGADGKDGKDGINGKDGANGKNGANGKDGADGVGIADIKLNENGELIVTLTDGTEKNLGKVKGEDGVGISGVSINENGELIVTLTDGTELNAGAVPTAAADDSNLKTLVYVSMGTAGISLAGLIGLLAFLLTKRKSLIGK